MVLQASKNSPQPDRQTPTDGNGRNTSANAEERDTGFNSLVTSDENCSLPVLNYSATSAKVKLDESSDNEHIIDLIVSNQTEISADGSISQTIAEQAEKQEQPPV
jgi:hypothetical protein